MARRFRILSSTLEGHHRRDPGSSAEALLGVSPSGQAGGALGLGPQCEAVPPATAAGAAQALSLQVQQRGKYWYLA